jgi:hypothetical protein
MSCPYFDPVAPRAQGAHAENATLPLGDEWAGLCRADPDQACEPDQANLRMLCNLGYARGACHRFPVTDGPDAARFTLLADNRTTLRLYYVLERDHQPHAHGVLEYSIEGKAFSPAPLGRWTPRQAVAYARSYLRRKAEIQAWTPNQ